MLVLKSWSCFVPPISRFLSKFRGSLIGGNLIDPFPQQKELPVFSPLNIFAPHFEHVKTIFPTLWHWTVCSLKVSKFCLAMNILFVFLLAHNFLFLSAFFPVSISLLFIFSIWYALILSASICWYTCNCFSVWDFLCASRNFLCLSASFHLCSCVTCLLSTFCTSFFLSAYFFLHSAICSCLCSEAFICLYCKISIFLVSMIWDGTASLMWITLLIDDKNVNCNNLKLRHTLVKGIYQVWQYC